MSEPSALCLDVTLHRSSFEAWWQASLLAPETWEDWHLLGVQPKDFALWRRVGQVRVGSILNDLLAQGRQGGALQESYEPGRVTLTALLAAENWSEQLLLLGAMRMLEGFGAADGWALMHDYVFESHGTAWAIDFPAIGRATVHLDAPLAIKSAADALVLPFLQSRRAGGD